MQIVERRHGELLEGGSTAATELQLAVFHALEAANLNLNDPDGGAESHLVNADLIFI